MDVENFALCLQYVQSTHPGFTLDKLIPVGAAFGGAIIGFGLNHFSSTKKENKASQNKKMCCEEDIAKIKRQTTTVASEVCNLCKILLEGRRPNHHRVPNHVSSLCLDEYFIDVAHKFNKDQREAIQMLLASLKILNSRLPELTNGGHASDYSYSTLLLNLSLGALEVWGHCEDFQRGTITHYSEEEVYKWLGLTDEQITSLNSLQANAKADNTELHLRHH